MNIEISNWENEIQSYISEKQSTANKNELYKWEAVKHFQDHFDIESDNFSSMLKNSLNKQSNLLYLTASTIFSIAEEYKEQVRSAFKILFDETQDLQLRVLQFSETCELLASEYKIKFREGDKKFVSGQDPRTIALYLAFRYPDKYYLYKDDYYRYLCTKLELSTKKEKFEKYFHYIELANEFKRRVLDQNSMLRAAVEPSFTANCYPDPENHILLQDFLYCLNREVKDAEGSGYWIFQGNPNAFDIEQYLVSSEEITWTVSRFADKIKSGDKVLIWKSGTNAGVVAFGTIIEDPSETIYEDRSDLWKDEEKESKLKCRIQLESLFLN